MRLSSGDDKIMTAKEAIDEWEWSRKANVVLDHFKLHRWGPGMSVNEVKFRLMREWRSEFRTDIPEETLLAFTLQLDDCEENPHTNVLRLSSLRLGNVPAAIRRNAAMDLADSH
jgi:hypothetical protein